MIALLGKINKFIKGGFTYSETKRSFSDFIRKSSLSEKENVFGEVMRQSNKDQRKILDAYSKKFPV